MTTKTYEVGFGKPPKRAQFKKGQSGNPKGRPRGTLNWATVLERALREKVVIKENGVRKTVTKLEAGVKRLTDKFTAGDFNTFRLVSAMVRSAEERANDVAVPKSVMEEMDKRVVLGILGRIEATSKEGNADETIAE